MVVKDGDESHDTLRKKSHEKQIQDKISIGSRLTNPIGSMYGLFTYIYHKNQPNVGKYTIHGSYGNRIANKK